jgi:hypothetical protein
MSSSTPKSPRWGRWFSVAVIMMLLGGAILLVYVVTKPKTSPTSSTQSVSEFSTEAANTFAAIQTASTVTPLLPAGTPVGSPSTTDFPQLNFTPPDTSTPDAISPVPISTANPCNDSAYVSDVTIPDGTIMAPGTSYVKTWAFQNTGSCIWDTNYQLVFVSGDLMGGVFTNLTESVAPSKQIQVSVSLIAPETEGTYTGYWRLADDQGNGFGGVVFVKIVVSNDASTSTPTVTPVFTNTRTPVATKTSAATPVSSKTPTATKATTATRTSTPVHIPTRTSKPVLTPTKTPVKKAPATSISFGEIRRYRWKPYQIWIPIPSAMWAASISASLSVGWACTLRAISAVVSSIM